MHDLIVVGGRSARIAEVMVGHETAASLAPVL